jgi:hypothetical protein
MPRILPVLVVVALALPPVAIAGGPGVNIRWDNCFDDGGLMNKTFACNTNTGQEQLVVSFVLADAMPDVSGQEIIVDIRSASATLPAWWAFNIYLTSINVTTPVLANNIFIGNASSAGSNIITWQGVGPDCQLVPTKNKTWGEVKALYR